MSDVMPRLTGQRWRRLVALLNGPLDMPALATLAAAAVVASYAGWLAVIAAGAL